MRKPIARNPLNTQISISLTKKLLDAIDRRAAALGMSRSQLIVVLIRMDLAERKALVIAESEPVEAGR